MGTVPAAGAITLDGIPLEVPDPEQYLHAIGSIVHHDHAHILSHGAELDRLRRSPGEADAPPDRRGAKGLIGYCGGGVIAGLIDREWSASHRSEFDVLAGYLASRGVIGAADSVLVCGAGTCRLGDFLASLDSRRSVLCTDLSWLMLYYGRALIEGRLDRLPAESRADRTYFAVRTDGTPRLVEQRSAPVFAPPLCKDPGRIRYAVRNAFHRHAGPECDLVVAPYVVDCHEGPGLRTMLIRILQQLRVGQHLLLLMECHFPSKRFGGRHPKAVADTVERAGLSITFLDVTELPYSFSMHGYGHVRTCPNTLVLRATRVAESDDARILLSTRSGTELPENSAPTPTDTRAIGDSGFSDLERLILEAGRNRVSYEQALRSVGSTDAIAFETAIGNLTSRQLVDLDVSS